MYFNKLSSSWQCGLSPSLLGVSLLIIYPWLCCEEHIQKAVMHTSNSWNWQYKTDLGRRWTKNSRNASVMHHSGQYRTSTGSTCWVLHPSAQHLVLATWCFVLSWATEVEPLQCKSWCTWQQINALFRSKSAFVRQLKKGVRRFSAWIYQCGLEIFT